MTTFGKVLEIFQDYLLGESCVEALPTKWGYVRLFYEEPYDESFDAVLCRTPEELFEVLLEHALAEQECRLAKESLTSGREMSEKLKAARDFYTARFQKGNI